MVNELIKFRLVGEYENPIEFTYPPMGWKDVQFSLRRDFDVHGVFEVSSLPVRFQDGYKDYIKDQYEKYGVGAAVKIFVDFLCENNTYNTVFEGALDFTTLVFYRRVENRNPLTSEKADNYLYCDCKIESISLADKLKQRAGIKIGLDNRLSAGGIVLEDLNQPFELIMHSQALFEFNRFVLPTQGIDLNGVTGFGGFFSSDNQELKTAKNEFWVKDEPGTPANYIVKNPTNAVLDLEVRIKGVLAVQYVNMVNCAGLSLNLAYRKETDPPGVTYLYSLDVPDSITNVYDYIDLDLVLTLTLAVGEHFWLGFTVDGTVSGASFNFLFSFDPDQIEVAYSSFEFFSVAKAWYAYEAFQRIISFCTDVDKSFISNTLGRVDSYPLAYPQNGKSALNAITNGLSIRNSFFRKEPQISFRELFDSFDAIWCLGWGEKIVNGQRIIVVENREDFYLDEVIHTFAKIDEINLIAWQDLYYQRVKIGYAKFENDETKNSLDEFNTIHQRFNERTQTNQEYARISSLIASGYAIERSRRNQFLTDQSKGDKYDEDNFIVAIRYAEELFKYFPEKNEEFEVVEGIESPDSRYNIRLSPARMFARHAKWVNGSLFRRPQERWRFASGQGNVKLVTQDTEDVDFADELFENQDFLLSETDPCLFQPELISFVVPFDSYLWTKLLNDDNRYKLIRVSHTEDDFLEGWINELKIDVNSWKMEVLLLRKNTGFIQDGLPPIVPEPPPQQTAQLQILGELLSTGQPGFTYLPGQPSKVGFKYNNGANSFAFEATVSDLDDFLPLVYAALIADSTLTANYDVLITSTTVLVKSKLTGSAYNFGTTIIGSIANITGVNVLVHFINV